MPGARAGAAAHHAKHHGHHGGHHGGERKGSKEKAFLEQLQKKNSIEDLEKGLNNEEEFHGLVSRYSREVFHDAVSLPSVVLMNSGKFEDLSVSDIKELFYVLDADKSGFMEFSELALLLQEVLDPPCSDAQVDTIWELTERREDGTIAPEEFHTAMKAGPVVETLKRVQYENKVKKELELKFGLGIPVDRDLMVDRLKWSVERDDAFRTLPFSLVYIVIFIFLVIAHLQIWPRQQLERSTVNWIEGYGGDYPGPYYEDVADIAGMFGWLEGSGLSAVFGDCKNMTDRGEVCRVGTRSSLVADAELKQTRRDGTSQSVWLLHTEQALQHLKSKPGDYLGAAKAAVSHVYNTGWADEGTMEISLTFPTYGDRAQLFAVTNIKVTYDDLGYVVPSTSVTSVVVTPYPLSIGLKVLIFTFDALYIIFLLHPLVNELKDLLHSMRHAGVADGLKSYLGFWNLVDWMSISMGIVSTQLWIQCVLAMGADSIQSLLREDDGKMKLVSGIMKLSEKELVQLQEDFTTIIGFYFILHLIMGCTSCSILLKFFKAFQANPRLKVVTATMTKAASDIAHFGVVFSAIFMGFALTGHIFFGNDRTEFRHFTASVDTCFIVLMGDFGWYVEESESDSGLGTGLSFSVMVAWFWLFMIFVLMILINMLLAIILDHYTELTNQIKMDADAPALWTQTFRYMAAAKKTKTHIPLMHLVTLLEDDDTPCHAQNRVTTHSLLDAFPTMQQEQAEHLLTWLRGEAKKFRKSQDDETLCRLKALQHFVETVTQDLHIVKLNTAVCASRLKKEGEGGVDHPTTPSSPARISMANTAMFGAGIVDQVTDQVNQLTLSISGVIRDLTGKMAGAAQDLSRQNIAVQEAMVCASVPLELKGTSSNCKAMPPCFQAGS